MESNITHREKWNLITIDDPKFLPGESFINIIKKMLEVHPFEYVILDYLDGCGNHGLIENLKKVQNTPINLTYLLELLPGVEQFDWCDFFLFTKYPKNWNSPEGSLYPQVISQTASTIRAVDGQYIYIYTPFQEIVDFIKSSWNIESFKSDFLENLDNPE